MKEIEFYTTSCGECPLVLWLETLSVEYKARVLKRINRMRDGNFGDSKRLKNNKLSEARLNFGKGYRVYYKEIDNIIVLLLAGSDKSDQKKVIKQADEYFEDYLKRNV